MYRSLRTRSIDTLSMETTDYILHTTCLQCERPALTFDERNRPLCSRHALIFITAPRVLTKDNERWTRDLSVKASPERSRDQAHQSG
jgi:hypothetical protein